MFFILQPKAVPNNPCLPLRVFVFPVISVSYFVTEELRLLVKHFGVDSAVCAQFGVRAVFDHMTAVEHRNLVRKLHRGQAVRDQDRALVGNHIVELSINLVLRHGIERGGRLVEKKYLAPVIACAGNRHPLSLAARQLNGILFFSAIDTHVIPLVQYRKCGCLLAFILIYFLNI